LRKHKIRGSAASYLTLSVAAYLPNLLGGGGGKFYPPWYLSFCNT
jgi:hypothetical protein